MTLLNHFVFIAQILLLPLHQDMGVSEHYQAADHRGGFAVPADNAERSVTDLDNFFLWNFNGHLDFPRPISTVTAATLAPLGTIKDWPEPALLRGHGGIVKMTLLNHFVFIAQVGKQYPCCLRSNNICLFLLPCPRSCLSVLCEFGTLPKNLLLLCGDVEVNPGPTLETILQKLDIISADVREIKLSQAETKSRLETIELQIKSLEGLRSAVNQNQDRTKQLESTVASLVYKIDDLENRSRRNNLIIFGLSELPNEDSSKLEERVTKEVLEDKLSVKTNGIERIHRLGKPTEGKTRPVILKLLDFRDKMKILRNCNRLKNEPLSISEDYSKRVQGIRKKLLESSKSNKLAGEKVTLMYDKVKINGKVYTWDDVKNDKSLIADVAQASSP
ncbi:uncharacterized protein LOC120839795 [Ixodes scapularis]|uniref:uncharacterized protein LOC120839795 n=1 Tax=Ixodes scapularis TaxID=6945 RepID=UPI001A9E9493|nr:uncharacterized protein LOC120839795 [Ixodes scapularis]